MKYIVNPSIGIKHNRNKQLFPYINFVVDKEIDGMKEMKRENVRCIVHEIYQNPVHHKFGAVGKVSRQEQLLPPYFFPKQNKNR